MESDSSRSAMRSTWNSDTIKGSVFFSRAFRRSIRSTHGGVIRETAFPTLPIFAPGVRCNRSRHKPTVQSRSGRGNSGDHARPAPASAQSTAPNIRALLAEESGNSRPPPSGPSRPGKVCACSMFRKYSPSATEPCPRVPSSIAFSRLRSHPGFTRALTK